MSLSGSSASRNSIWAMTRLASSSSMKVGRKMIRSLRRREKMSKARSPRGVCSTTIGTRAMLKFSFLSARDACVLDQKIQSLALSESVPEGLQVAGLLHHTTDGRRRSLAGAREFLDLRLQVGLAGVDGFLVGDRLQQQRSPHALFGGGAELADDLAVVPLDAIGVHALAAEPVAGVLDLVRDLAHDHGV